MPPLRVQQLDLHKDPRGSLIALEGNRDVPFAIERVYYVFDTAPAAERGAHAHKATHQFAVCVAGHCTFAVDNGTVRSTFRLDRRDRGLYLPPMLWCETHAISPDCVLMVLADRAYDDSDYIKDYETFATAAAAERAG